MKYPNHIQYIIENYSLNLQARLAAENIRISIDNAIDTLMACDPSEDKKLVDWLVKTYIEGGFRWEDVEIEAESKLAEVLGMYKQYFNQIPRDQRNIYQYKSYGELYTLLKPLNDLRSFSNQEVLGSREVRRRERAQALEESEVLWRSEECIVAVPLTENAAKWWGRGTKWCTAAENNNMFDRYNRNAPLIVITLMNKSSSRGVEKFQLWTDGNDVQFMDAQDCSVAKETVQKHWKLFKPFVEYMLEQNYKGLDYIPEKLQSVEVCTRAVQQNPYALLYISNRLKNLEMYRLAVEKDGSLLDNVPIRLRTPEVCMLAVKQNGDALRSVLKKHRTAELCRLAVEQNGLSIAYVPQELQTTELLWLALKTNPLAIGFIQEKFRTNEMYRYALEKNGVTLQNILPSLVTAELCELAVASNGEALSFVPNHLKTMELCIKAVEKCGSTIICVPNEYKTYELCRLAVEQDPMIIGCIPEKFINSDLYRIAIEKNGMAIHNISFYRQTHELISIAINQDPKVFRYLFDRFKTPEVCKQAVERDGELIACVPRQYRTPELIAAAKSQRKEPEWNQSVISPLRDRLNQYFKAENCDEISQSYPIHH